MITAKTSLYGLIGNPVDHSVSPLMHNTAFKKLGIDAVYLAFKSENTEDTISALKTLGARGFNCTMPAKSDCAVLCDKLSEEAELTKSVNTVVVEGDKLTGHSTDGAGFFLNLKNNGVDYDKNILLLGAGGAARSIAARAVIENVPSLTILNRTVKKAKALADSLASYDTNINYGGLDELPEAVKKADIIINATSYGMGEDKSIVDGSLLRPDQVVCDIVYKPRETALLKAAKKAGCKTVDGLGMVACQAAYAFELWTGKEFPLGEILEVLEKN